MIMDYNDVINITKTEINKNETKKKIKFDIVFRKSSAINLSMVVY